MRLTRIGVVFLANYVAAWFGLDATILLGLKLFQSIPITMIMIIGCTGVFSQIGGELIYRDTGLVSKNEIKAGMALYAANTIFDWIETGTIISISVGVIFGLFLFYRAAIGATEFSLIAWGQARLVSKLGER